MQTGFTHNISFRYVVIAILLIFSSIGLSAQSSILDEYIRTGLKNNLQLQMKSDSLNISIEALREAKSMYFPSISLNARYSVAQGGRMIDFPVGDLLNPVYSSLNNLTSSNMFTPVANVAIPFLRPTEHETKLRLVQPIFNRDIYYNKKINENYSQIRKTDVDKYSRELIAEIKIAYYNYLQSIELEKILASGMNVLVENLRVNESLLANDKITRDAVLQAEAELAGIREDMASAEMMKFSSEAWFNYLLNRDLQEEIVTGDSSIILPMPAIQTVTEQALQDREDLLMLDQYLNLTQNNLNLNKSSRLPNLMAVVDYGYQGAEYRFTQDDDFVMASFLLTWDIFKGFQNTRKISQAEIQREVIVKKREEAEKLISLEVINAWYDLATAAKKISASEDRARSSTEAFRMIDKRYAQGQTGMLEYTSARRNMTEAETKLVIARYSYLSKYAEFERAAGLVELRFYE